MIGRTRLVVATLLASAGCTTQDPGDTAGSTSQGGVLDTGTLVPTTSTSPDSTGGASTTDASSSGFETSCRCENCGEALIAIPMPPIDAVLVLDKGGAMNTTWDHDADPMTPEIRRWESLARAVDEVVNTFNDSLRLGLALSPSVAALDGNTPAEACPVEDPLEVAVEPFNAANILAAMPAATSDAIRGGAPASAAVAAAISALSAGDPAVPRHIVYATGSAANCNGNDATAFETYDETLHDRVTLALADDAITTHVIGLAIADATSPVAVDGAPDMVNNHERLDELAIQGGAPLQGDPKYHAATTEAGLTAALTDVFRAVLPCTVALEPPPTYPETVEIRVGDLDFGKAQVTDCATEDGWLWAEPGVSIELCGLACSAFEAAGALDAIYRCPPDGGGACCG